MHINNPFQDQDFAKYQIIAGKAKAIENINQQIVYIYPLFNKYTILYTSQNHPQLKTIAKKHNAIYTLIESTETNNAPYKKQIKEIIPRFTNIIDLTQNEESILEKMHQKGRYNIRLAKKRGIEIQESNDINSFYKILETTAKRDHFHINPKKFYQTMLDTLASSNKAKLFLAYHPESKNPIAGILNTYIEDTATYYYGASDHQYRKYMAPYLLQWHAIQDAKQNNFKTYDFLGVANPNNPKDPLQGVTSFKNKFGGKTIQYKNSKILIHNYLLYILLKIKKAIT